jgi:hypothetical protein
MREASAMVGRVAAFMALVALIPPLPALALDSATECEATKLSVAGSLAKCHLRAESRAVKAAAAPNISRCDETFLRRWAAAEAGAGGTCPTAGDGSLVLALLTDCAAAVPGGTPSPTTSTVATTSTTTTTLGCTALSGCFCDLGDGTVLDTCTGLQWEKKNGANGTPGMGTRDYSNAHDVDNAYTWTDLADGDGTNPDGTMFTEFLGALNESISADGITVSGCFAGHCDWRLPQIDELRTLIDPSASGCGSSAPCINPIFGPTAASAGNYSTGTTVAGDRAFPWVVFFFDGTVNDGVVKYDDDFVRAVRARGPSASSVAAPKVIFTTLETVTPEDNGPPLGFFVYPSRGDDICNHVASDSPLLAGKHFVAAVCGREPDVADGADLGLRQRTTDSLAGYVRTDGARIADNLSDLLDGTIQVPMSYDQFGNLLPDVESGDVIPVWTGCSAYGDSLGVSLQCAYDSLPSWWDSSNITYAEVGRPDRVDEGWFAFEVNSCIFGRHLYCIEQ